MLRVGRLSVGIAQILRRWLWGACLRFGHGRPGLCRPPVARLMVSMGLAAPLLGCALGEGLDDVGGALFDANSTHFSKYPKQLMQGSYQRAALVASAGVEAHLLALTDETEAHLLIQGVSDDEACNAGPASDFEQFTTPADDLLVIRTTTAPDDRGRQTFRFFDTDCDEVVPKIEDALLLEAQCSTGRCIQVYLQDNGTVVFLDPVRVERVHAVEHVKKYASHTFHYLLSEDGTLSYYDLLDPTQGRQYAANVQTFSLGSGADEVFVQTDEGIVYSSLDDARIDGACLLPLSGQTSTFQVMESPCNSGNRFLLFADWEKGELVQYPLPDSLDPITQAFRHDFSDLFLATQKDTAALSSDLFYVADFETTASASDPLQVAPLLEKVDSYYWNGTQGGLVLAEFDGETGLVSDISENSKGKDYSFSPIASDVRRLWTSEMCAGYTIEIAAGDGLSDLACVDPPESAVVPLVEKVASGSTPRPLLGTDVLGSWFAHDWQTVSSSFVTHVKAGGGQLEILDFEKLSVVDRHTPEVGPVIQNSSAMSQEPRAATYVSAKDHALWVYYPDLDESRKVANAVVSYTLLEQPSPALLYVVGKGRDAGIWLSKAE